MAKMPKWSKKEITEMKRMLDKRFSYQNISKKLKRSVFAIKIKIARIKYKPLCLDCKKRVERKGNRLRCKECVLKRKRLKSKEWYYNNLESRKIKRDKIRFGSKRESAILRDKEKCVCCGMTRKEHYSKFGCDITVDHINGKGRNSNKQDNALKNLQTLCLICHGKKDAKRRRQDWSMCIKKLLEQNKGIKRHCTCCGKKIKWSTERFHKQGNFCDKCA